MLVSCRPTDSGIVIADITPTEYGARLHVLKIVTFCTVLPVLP